MATISKRSSRTFALLLIVSFLSFLTISCNNEHENGVWIPVPPDTSALGKIDHFIPVKTIEQFRKSYDIERDSISRKQPTLYLPYSEAFNKMGLIDVLKDPRCVGIRVYYGATGDRAKGSEFRLIIVGVDEQGKDLYIKKGSKVAAQAGDEEVGGLEYGQCPPCAHGRG
jgi:hypothetical protein